MSENATDGADGLPGGTLIDSAYSLLPDIRGMADEIDDARRLPDRLADKLADAGFFRMLLDREMGGLEVDPLTAAQVVETLSTVSPSVGWVTMIVASTNFWTARVLPDEAVTEVFTPGAAVNVVGNLVPHGQALRVDGGWRVSGQWPMGSGCHHADWMASGGWLHDDQGPVMDGDVPAWRVFYTPIGDCRILDTWHSTGLRGTGSHDYTMDDVFVPDRLVSPHPLRAPNLRPNRHYTYSAMVVAAMASVALGGARGAVDSLIEILRRSRSCQAVVRRRPISTSKATWAPQRPLWAAPGPICMTLWPGVGEDHRRRAAEFGAASPFSPGLHQCGHRLSRRGGPCVPCRGHRLHLHLVPCGAAVPRRPHSSRSRRHATRDLRRRRSAAAR